MSGPGAVPAGVPSAFEAEKHARRDSGRDKKTPKLRSCVVCRSRKVRCDKRAPCSNCRRANIACVFPPTDRPPRWARHLDQSASSERADGVADGVMERLHHLEKLVADLSSQLEQTKSVAPSAGGSSVGSPESSAKDRPPNLSAGNESMHTQLGRLVIQDSNRSRYVSSGFWSRVNDELDSLKFDAHNLFAGGYASSDGESLPDETSSTWGSEQTHAARHGFLFGHNLNSSSPDLDNLHPLPSQIPFLLDLFSDNVNMILQVVHLPTVRKMVRDWRDRDMKGLTPAQEALMFSIYYAAITSMEDEDTIRNFGTTKAELSLRYRQGLEHALARANFLGAPDLTLVQAFAIFLGLLRRYESPAFVWMMTGLAIRMGQALGLHRDGSHFDHLSPYEVEIRRRVWWVLCILDVRASEDQGMDYTIPSAGFDTKIPLNLNDSDLDPQSKEMPPERDSLTDMSVARVSFGICEVTRQMMAHGFQEKAPTPEKQSSLLDDMFQGVEREYLRYATDSENITYWAIVIVTRLVMAKMSLLVYLPLLFCTSKEDFSEELRARLLVSGIEVAEYNHALNSERACRQWRWAFQTYTHWYSIVFMMLEISRAPWSPISERAWVALHSVWLIPTRSHMDKDLRIWIPLRKLMSNARKHRQAEIIRLANDTTEAQRLEYEYRNLPTPSSSGPFPVGSDSADQFLERWHRLIQPQSDESQTFDLAELDGAYIAQLPIDFPDHTQPLAQPKAASFVSGMSTTRNTEEKNPTRDHGRYPRVPALSCDVATSMIPGAGETVSSLYNPTPGPQDTKCTDHVVDPWTWSDGGIAVEDPTTVAEPPDPNIDMDEDINWYRWVESAQGVEWDVSDQHLSHS
ncbi:unnamed protein product [Penicillium salamii]|nr:unnamed protein product [Penicillium salamii]CAG8269622.1 unnamed protein product [Penicillium salamii]CAG8405195.1 unnamed protein product [Penicillium salamii]